MGKVKSFAAKLAHESSGEGKVICPICNTEVKRIKAISNKKADENRWSPRYEFVKLCKCNEESFMKGKTA